MSRYRQNSLSSTRTRRLCDLDRGQGGMADHAVSATGGSVLGHRMEDYWPDTRPAETADHMLRESVVLRPGLWGHGRGERSRSPEMWKGADTSLTQTAVLWPGQDVSTASSAILSVSIALKPFHSGSFSLKMSYKHCYVVRNVSGKHAVCLCLSIRRMTLKTYLLQSLLLI
ncbi:unnamed protein product [Arctogadus glacialis]